MIHFSTAKEAKEFLVAQITDQAQRQGVPLSEIERKMLFFSERYWTLPDMMKVNDEFDEKYDSDEYERKISDLIAQAYKRAKSDGPDAAFAWNEALRLLSKEDHYILVMTARAGLRNKDAKELMSAADPVFNFRTSSYFFAFLFVCTLGAFLVITRHFGFWGRTGGVVSNDRLNRLAGYGWLVLGALALLWFVGPFTSRRR
jgi:hypothetical protein